jgi:biopolymer transport protein ExbB/TolQ
MRIELNTDISMQIRTILTKINPWIGLLGTLCIILPSLYDILDAPLTITNDHFILAGGLFFFVVFLKQIFDRIINLEDIE